MQLNYENFITPSMFDIEAEEAVLGCILQDNQMFYEVSGMLKRSSFWENKNNLVFSAMVELMKNDQVIDEISIGDQLKKDKTLEQAGGYAYIANLWDCVPSSMNIVNYGNIVAEKSAKREVVELSVKSILGATDESKTADTLVGEVDKKLSSIGNYKKEDFVSFREGSTSFFEKLERISENAGQMSGISFGLTDLDKATNGMQPGGLITIGGRPGTGKSGLALNFAKSASKAGSVLIFSLEMPVDEVIMRLVADQGSVDSNKFKNGGLTDTDWDNVSMAVDQLSERNIYIDDNPNRTIFDIKSAIKRKNEALKKAGKPAVVLVVLDYLQLIQKSDKRKSIYESVSENVQECRKVAKEEMFTFMVLSQLNRELEKRSDKRPQCSDLRESGAIEQESTLILFIYRDELYNDESKDKGLAEIIIGKQRDGILCTIKTQFQGKYYRFNNLSNYEA